jgi:hypothetical protein
MTYKSSFCLQVVADTGTHVAWLQSLESYQILF